MGGHGGLNILP